MLGIREKKNRISNEESIFIDSIDKKSIVYTLWPGIATYRVLITINWIKLEWNVFASNFSKTQRLCSGHEHYTTSLIEFLLEYENRTYSV